MSILKHDIPHFIYRRDLMFLDVYQHQDNDDLSLNAGFSLWTSEDTDEPDTYITRNGNEKEFYLYKKPSALRNGNLFGGVNYSGNSYRAGYNSKGIRRGKQNNYNSLIGVPHFTRMSYDGRF